MALSNIQYRSNVRTLTSGKPSPGKKLAVCTSATFHRSDLVALRTLCDVAGAPNAEARTLIGVGTVVALDPPSTDLPLHPRSRRRKRDIEGTNRCVVR
mmetsp:Transcript_253/g.2027  ORF Transcript_253/g.2027 Transcript_253/m.2027 type:complete len:98 (+) Transcript_253:2514-2807(+)